MSSSLTSVCGVLLLAVLAAPAQSAAIQAWPVDPHAKVFRDSLPPNGTLAAAGKLYLRAARNEFEPAQLAVRSPQPLKGLAIELAPLEGPEGRALPAEAVSWNFVGFIPLKKNTRDADELRIRKAPCEVPDPLLGDRSLDVPANSTQPVWITVRVPKDAAPGTHSGHVQITAGGERATLPVELVVLPFALPDERHLFVTNWFRASHIARTHKVEPWSDAHWTLLSRYARNMAGHRQNVALVPWTLIAVTREADGTLSFDYARFDRFVQTFQEAGAADRIELGHLGHFGKGGWGGSEIVLRKVSATDAKTGKTVHLGPEEGLQPLLADLQRHLAKKGWLETAMIHVADEPSINNIRSWREASAFVHAAAPKLRRMDAIETIGFSGALEVWVPKLSHYHRWYAAYQARRADGEFWYYICCHPYGNVYPNRFLDYPLAAVRVLHWINFAEDLQGYLHWGLTFWGDDPFGVPRDRLPPGDTHVIYPGNSGPLNSIRWEMQRESLEDFEYLHLLAAKTAEMKAKFGAAADFIQPQQRAKELCRRVVPSIPEWERDPARILDARRQIADEIVALDAEPLLLVQTEPAAGSTLVNGPIVVEVRGATRPGTAVKVNGRETEVRPDGSFATLVHGSRAATVTIEAEKEGKTKKTTRRFETVK
jgi:hypothetical protein